MPENATQYSTFKLVVDGAVAQISLDRPAQLNALTAEFFKELPQAIRELEDTGSTRVVLLTGEGNHFCSGMDLSFFANDFLETTTTLERERFRRLVLQYQEAITSLQQSRLPVVAAIQGACVGGALDLVSACDLRFITQSAFFCVQEIHLGIMADLGTLQRLPKLMPDALVRELAFTGDRLLPDRALAAGFVNQIFSTQDELLEHARAVCSRIAQRSPLAVAASKEAINFARDHSVDDSLRQAAAWQSAIFDKKQLLQAISAQKTKTDLAWHNLLPALSQ